MTPFQLCTWASKNIPAVTFNYCTIAEYEVKKASLEKRFEEAQTIPGTCSMHSYILTSIDTLRIRRYSDSLEYREERVVNELDIADISGYITCVYNSKWWLACVLETDKENAEVIVMLLHPCRPSRSFKYPSKLDIQILPLNSILTIVDARTTAGRTYTIGQEDSKITTDKFCEVLIYLCVFWHTWCVTTPMFRSITHKPIAIPEPN